MKRKYNGRNLFAALWLSAFLCSGVLANAQPFLKAQKGFVVGADGEKFMLRGMGLGGWMLQEGYMYKLSDLGQQHRIRAAITKSIGSEKAARFYDQWLEKHTQKADIDSLAAWGFNSVRLPMHYRLFTLSVEEEPVKGRQTWLEKGFAMTDSLLSWCKANGIFLILDLHAAPGGQGNDLPISDRDPAKPSLWEDPANQDKVVALWRKLAERYSNEPYIGGYDLLNETNWGFEHVDDKIGNKEQQNKPLKALFERITKAIREVDKNHMIILEGNAFANNYRGLEPVWDHNMVISFHKYGNFADVASIQSFLDLRSRYGLPLWLGEAGENANTWFANTIALMEAHDIGWSWWPNKKMGINNPLEVRMPEGYDQLVADWTGKGERLPRDRAEKILKELLHNLAIENNRIHYDVVDAMFRQVKDWTTKPFKIYHLNKELTIPAVDYDLGRNNAAYFDQDTCSYRFVAGVHTTGNRGGMYRNDGVDIAKDVHGDGYHVFAIEDKEWLQYTFQVDEAGTYALEILASVEKADGVVAMLHNGQSNDMVIKRLSGQDGWKSYPAGEFSFNEGKQTIRLQVKKGGFLLKSIRLTKDDG